MEENILCSYGRDSIIEVDLDALGHNVRQFKKHLPTGTKIMGVVKANAYGHGSVHVARALIKAGVSYLGVAFVDEGIELRNAQIDVPILILGYTPPHAVADALYHQLELTVFSYEQLHLIKQIAQQLNIPARIHIKVDTGMGRIGLQCGEAIDFVINALEMDQIEVLGLFTHLATADEKNKEYLNYQKDRFMDLVTNLKEQGICIPLIHMTNSAGSIEIPDSVFTMVRLGISLYGYYPSENVSQKNVLLKPVLSFKSKIVHVNQPAMGTGISYGATYIAKGDEWIATVAVGYSDGLNRHLSNKGWALVGGKRVPIVGKICMDQLMLDVTQVMPVQVGDEVVLYGRQGDEQILVDDVATMLGTISYEVTCMLSLRVPRIYLQGGKQVAVINPLR